MSSLHHLPKDSVESVVRPNLSPNGDQIGNLIDDLESIDNIDTVDNIDNGTAYGQYFETVDILSDNSVIIGSDNLKGTQFNGYVTKYERIEDVPQMPVLSLSPTYGGISNLIATRDRKLICSFDSGHISKLSDGLEQLVSVAHHENQICGLSVDRLETKSISCGYDMSLLVLDLNNFVATKCYRYAHSAVIWDNAFNQFDDNLVMTCSRDKNVLLWDLRKQRPASKVTQISTEPTALCWSQKDMSCAFIGTGSGEVLSVDIRNCKIEGSTKNSTSSRIHRIKNLFNGRVLAICSDDNYLLVVDSKCLETIYEDKTSHSNWVRAVTQHNNILYSVGRDTRLVCHSNFNPDLSSIEMSDPLASVA